MSDNSFALQIGSLLFTRRSLTYILLGLFLLGLLAGLLSIIHIDNPDVSPAVTTLLLGTSALPIVLITKGIRRAHSVS